MKNVYKAFIETIAVVSIFVTAIIFFAADWLMCAIGLLVFYSVWAKSYLYWNEKTPIQSEVRKLTAEKYFYKENVWYHVKAVIDVDKYVFDIFLDGEKLEDLNNVRQKI